MPSHWRLAPPRGMPPNTHRIKIMEAERVNLIGTTLADLSQRTEELRRYL